MKSIEYQGTPVTNNLLKTLLLSECEKHPNEYEWDATPKARTKLTLPVDSIGAKSATTPAICTSIGSLPR